MQRQTKVLNSDNSGFTLIEALVVVVLIAILAAIAAPSWLAFLNRQRVEAVRTDLISTLGNIQTSAQQRRSYQTVWIDVNSDTPRVLYGNNNVTDVNTLTAQPLGPDSLPSGAIVVKAYTCADDPCVSTSTDWVELTNTTGPCNSLAKACFQFNYKGEATDPGLEILPATAGAYPGSGPRVPFKIEILPAGGSSTKSCVVVANLLGRVKSGSDDFCEISPGEWSS